MEIDEILVSGTACKSISHSLHCLVQLKEIEKEQEVLMAMARQEQEEASDMLMAELKKAETVCNQ